MKRNPREALEELRARHLFRRRRIVQEWPAEGGGALAIVAGEKRLVFCSNDYLGLKQHPRVIAAFREAANRFGAGSGASHLITGHTSEHHALEEELAAFTGRESALLFSTGYMANLAVPAALLTREDLVLEDRLNHASLLDAGLLCGARFHRYPHADAAAAERRLLEHGSGSALVMTDGVFSMDGDVAPLGPLAEATARHDAWLMVDDAHGLGILGARGRGTLEAFGLSSGQVPILMGTLGKALGSFGAFVAGDRDLIELLVQKARTYIYTTALPPGVAAATRVALRLIDEESWRRERVLAYVEHFRTRASELGIALGPSRTPIQPVILGDTERTLAVSEALWRDGFWVSAIRPPTVPEGAARLRVTFSAAHTEEQIDALLAALTRALAANG